MRPNPYRDCLKCGQPVHARTPSCKGCGAVSPWAKAPEPEQLAAKLAGSDVDPFDVLSGDLANVAPHLHVVPTPIDLEPSAETVAAYIHDITAPARAAEAARELIHSGPHVFMDKFSTMIGSSLAHFKVNDVVTDFPLLQELKAQDAPMVPVGNAPGMACCPACKTVFKVPKPVPAKRVG